jgi:hypothetical protein
VVHSFFEGTLGIDDQGREVAGPGARHVGADCIVWAARGSGKTFLGALATALDLLFKPGIEVRILGGSLEQSLRMHAHLVDLLSRDGVRAELAGKPTQRGVKLRNGSRAEVLAQSESSVRGTRVQKLRCDEVDLFDRGVWEAAQLTTRSKRISGPWGPSVRGAVHSSSTMHVAGGLMSELIEGAGGDGMKVFRWSVMDTLERCGASEDCQGCVLWSDCGGAAKGIGEDEAGHVSIDDARQMKRRVSLEVWQSEMLCQRPLVRGAVFPMFGRDGHIVKMSDAEQRSLVERVTREAVWRQRHGDDARLGLVCGMDFGLRAPTVILWAVHEPAEDGGEVGMLTVLDEYVQTGRTIGEHVGALVRHRLGMARGVWCDPAGHARNDQTGISAIAAMNAAGVPAIGRSTGIVMGIEALRLRLAPASGPVRLKIDARCVHLIKSLTGYRYNERDARDELPLKDGNDHAVDALRYLVMGVGGSGERARRYA